MKVNTRITYVRIDNNYNVVELELVGELEVRSHKQVYTDEEIYKEIIMAEMELNDTGFNHKAESVRVHMSILDAEMSDREKVIANSPGDVFTHPDYWDCSCDKNYIHKKADELICPICGAIESDGWPDSRWNEIQAARGGVPDIMFSHLKYFQTELEMRYKP